MIVKVCGILDQQNHEGISSCNVDMIGINFYKPSKRYIGENQLEIVPNQKRIGVFVKSSKEEILHAKKRHLLDYAQLHGDEIVAMCRDIQSIIPIIKVFRITEEFDWKITEAFGFADYFLFDTFTKVYGGSGKRFNWSELIKYEGSTPFFLSGGIGPDDVKAIKRVNHPKLIGVDINSGFEEEPGIKNIEKVRSFTTALKRETHDLSSR